tara:strand:+ start:826 stop:1617 length:792 start_codon:yes stop_codon:yes gene_type:complete
MQPNNSKNQMILADLHCHTVKSYDAFTTNRELLNACIVKGINLIAITEHDLVNKIQKKDFHKNGINVIDGCEYTTNRGAHIIGLFVNKPIKNANYKEIIEHIKNQAGIVLIPHPFKKGSGVCAIYKDPSYILSNSDMIELYNGGYKNSKFEEKEILSFSRKYNINLLANSDSHKVDQIGYYVNYFKSTQDIDLKSLLLNNKPELFIDKSSKKAPRNPSIIQKNKNYQSIIIKVPFFIKRFIKFILYLFSKRKPFIPSYSKLIY